MYHYTLFQWLLCFYIYCFVGWCWESAYVSVRKRQWINRGFMHGPFLPIYGSGAVMMLVVSEPFADNVLLTYLAGMVGATTLELVTGIVMESLFKMRYWDYSTKKWNFRGYICLSSSLAWGLFTVLMTGMGHKPVDALLNRLSEQVTFWVTLVLTAVIGTDFVISFIGALNLSSMLGRLENAKAEVALLQRRLDAVIAFSEQKMETEVGQRREELKAAVHEALERVTHLRTLPRRKHRGRILGNPTMVSRRYRESLEELKQFLRESGKK